MMIQLKNKQKKNNLVIIKLILILVTCLYSFSTYSQEISYSLIDREGFFGGIAIGGGALAIDDEGEVLQYYGRTSLLNLKLGYHINSKNAICFQVPSGGHNENDETRAFEAILLNGQHWFGEKFWSSVGFGLAMDMPPFYDVENDDPEFHFGQAASLAIGYEVWQKGRFIINVQARYMLGHYKIEGASRNSNALDCLIGLSIY